MKQTLLILLIVIWGCNSNDEKTLAEVVSNEVPKTESVPKKEIQNGDLIFHTSMSGQSMAVQIASKSKYSHVGLIVQEGDDFFVYEAVQPVKITPLDEFIKRGKDNHYVLKRLKNNDEILNPESISKMKTIGKKYLGKDYDLRFEWSDDKIYCSELVWKIYKEAFDIEIGALEQIKDFDLSDPEVQKKVKERYGNKIPLEEPIITPDRMFKSEKLETIPEK